jgi:hypothetical protein
MPAVGRLAWKNVIISGPYNFPNNSAPLDVWQWASFGARFLLWWIVVRGHTRALGSRPRSKNPRGGALGLENPGQAPTLHAQCTSELGEMISVAADFLLRKASNRARCGALARPQGEPRRVGPPSGARRSGSAGQRRCVLQKELGATLVSESRPQGDTRRYLFHDSPSLGDHNPKKPEGAWPGISPGTIHGGVRDQSVRFRASLVPVEMPLIDTRRTRAAIESHTMPERVMMPSMRRTKPRALSLFSKALTPHS